ncbi:MAG: GTP-binding protein [Acidaminobacter sp.]|uniref:CobW family GTP-binding protein n=1 Tax=Acidaminobacter sp. TaxID=1872102 RepID=UPI00138569E5|nr:GTP-binding protein [Acidaminobacter sp.]MZQ97490.1 GTP-binding protein [Acidaminobacter sp.]
MNGNGDEAMNVSAIELILISGFLGAGKTTCLQRLIDKYQDKRLGLLINEFGRIGIDGKLIKVRGAEILELNNGSIFCSCLKGSFIEGLIDFSELPIDMLIIECSGLADPSEIGTLLSSLTHKLKRPFCLSHSICVVDGLLYEKQVSVLTAIAKQICSANLIMINKKDLIDTDTLAQITTEISRLNPGARIVPTDHCNVDTLVSGMLPILDIASENTPERRPGTFILKFPDNVKIEELNHFLVRAAEECYRIKGFVHTQSGWMKIDAISEHVEIISCDIEKSESQLVLILRQRLTSIHQFKSLWESNATTKMEIQF